MYISDAEWLFNTVDIGTTVFIVGSLMSRLKLAGQVAALGLVASLLVLLTWKVVQSDQIERRPGLHEGEAADGGGLRPEAAERRGLPAALVAAREGRRDQLLGRLVRPVQERGSALPVGVRALSQTGSPSSASTRPTSPATAARSSAKYGVSYPNVRDPNGRVLSDYGGLPIPRTFVVARSGRVHAVHLRRGARGAARERDQGGARSVRLLAAAFAALALVAVPAAVASEEHPTSLEIQQELWCDDCQTTLDEANAVTYTPHIMGFIRSRIAAGETKTQIKNEAVVKYRYHVSLVSSKSVAPQTTLADLEDEVMCPVCHTTLDQSSSGAARQIKTFISQRIAAGDSKNEIKDELVADYGPQILAAPPKKGFDLLAWLLPHRGRARRRARPRGARLALEPRER